MQVLLSEMLKCNGRKDHLHTSPTGANVVAEAFVRGVLCSTSTLRSFVNSAGEAVPSELPL